jgi:hypothetical protein
VWITRNCPRNPFYNLNDLFCFDKVFDGSSGVVVVVAEAVVVVMWCNDDVV